MANIIETTGLTKSFGKIIALNGLDLKAVRGVSGFVGPNGSGKTTTINIILGLLKPDDGEASVFGLDCWHESFEIRQRVGVLHEKPGYPRNFTGARYLEHVAHIYRVSQPKLRTRELLKEVGLHEAGDRAIKTYSAGMIQRLGLAQALIGDPKLVILDEPTSNLDPMGRMELLEKIKELHKDYKVNFFISTHILTELEKVCGWISIIKDGMIVDQGFVGELAAKYSANVYRIMISNPNLFAEKLQAIDAVERTWVVEEMLYCRVKNKEDFYEKVPQLAAELNLRLRELQPLYGTLEEIYKKAIKGGDG